MEQEKIDRYVMDEMSIDERNMFEQAMKQNGDLRKEVTFGKELKSFFANREPSLESQLEKLGNEHFADEPSGWSRWWWVPVALALFGGVGYLFMDTPIDVSNEMIDTSEKIRIEPRRQPSLEKLESNPSVSEGIQQTQDPVITPSESSEKEIIPPAQPIAVLNPADFAPNPILESLMNEQLRNEGFKTKLISPSASQVFDYEEKILWQFNGITTAMPPYQLMVYSNKGQDFEKGIGVLSKTLEGELKGEQYQFNFSAMVPFERGLYYLLFQEQEGEEILSIERFLVK